MFSAVKRWLMRPATDAPNGRRAAIQSQSRCLDAYREGLAHFQSGNPARAAQMLERALEFDPNLAEAHYYLGIIYRKQQRLLNAEESFILATALKPGFHKAWFRLGVVALDLNRPDEAAAKFNEALRLQPGYAVAWNGLGNVHLMKLDYRAAIESFQKAIEFDARLAIAYNNLAYATLSDSGDVETAHAYIMRALELEPDMAGAHHTLAMIMQMQGRCSEALISCGRALELNPRSTDTLWVRGLSRLMCGQFAEGWSDYEVRKTKLDTFKVRRFPYAEWEGQPLLGRNLLVYYEQGIGDEIMFASCLPDLVALGGSVVVECSAKLERLFQRSFPSTRIQVADQSRPDMSYLQALPRFDWQVAAGSLPRFFRRHWSEFPEHGGYLAVATERVAVWRNRLKALGQGVKIGLSWRGGTRRSFQSARSIALDQLLTRLALPGARLVSLQYGECRDEIENVCARTGVLLHHWQEAIDDYDETAALVSALDVVISVQTAVVHLSGALGKLTWALIPSTPEWRYMANGDRMPWYPSVRLFRQHSRNDWQPVINEIAARAQEMVAGRVE